MLTSWGNLSLSAILSTCNSQRTCNILQYLQAQRLCFTDLCFVSASCALSSWLYIRGACTLSDEWSGSFHLYLLLNIKYQISMRSVCEDASLWRKHIFLLMLWNCFFSSVLVVKWRSCSMHKELKRIGPTGRYCRWTAGCPVVISGVNK